MPYGVAVLRFSKIYFLPVYLPGSLALACLQELQADVTPRQVYLTQKRNVFHNLDISGTVARKPLLRLGTILFESLMCLHS